jgi:hypothetical protein
MEISEKDLSFKKKYMKYKAKYMTLKNMTGGGYFKDIAGAGKMTNHKSYYIMADIGNPAINAAFNQRRNCILGGASGGNFHLTLLTIEINRDLKPYAQLLEDSIKMADGKTQKTLKPILQQMVTDAYNDTFMKSRVVLIQERGQYHKMGSYFAKRYPIASDAQILTDSKGNITPTISAFRKSFYDKLRKYLGVDFTFDTTSNSTYVLAVDKYKNVIFAIPRYDFGTGVWDPHVSIIKEDEIRISNPALYGKITSTMTPDEEILKCLLPHRFNELPNIDMSNDIGSIKIA